MSRPTVLLLAMDDAQQADVRLALKDIANVVRSKTPAELIADEYRNLNPGAAIVAVRPDAPNRFGLIHNVAAAGGVVIVISPTKDPELILRSMRAGAREFVLESDHEELRLAVRTHAKMTVAGGDIGQVVTIFGAKGGVGSTAIAVNLAGSMQRRGAAGRAGRSRSAPRRRVVVPRRRRHVFDHRRAREHEPARSGAARLVGDQAPLGDQRARAVAARSKRRSRSRPRTCRRCSSSCAATTTS